MNHESLWVPYCCAVRLTATSNWIIPHWCRSAFAGESKQEQRRHIRGKIGKAKLRDGKERGRKKDRGVTEGCRSLDIHLSVSESGRCNGRKLSPLTEWRNSSWSVRSKAQMTVMLIITAFTLVGGHQMLRWLCQSRESPWCVCVCVCLNGAYIGVYACLFGKKGRWLTLLCFSDFEPGLWRNRGFFRLQQLLRRSVSQSVHQVKISVIESVSAGEQRPGSLRLFLPLETFAL